MNLESILKKSEFDLPNLFNSKGNLSLPEIEQILIRYKEEINNSTDLFDGILAERDPAGKIIIKYDIDIFKNLVFEVIDGIRETLITYLNGSPALAYKCLDDTINSNPYFKGILVKKEKIIERETIFYRLRCGTDTSFSYPLTGKQIFHVPFEKRYLIGTQRFSIPGYPCLYLAGSLLTACSELDILIEKDKLREARIVAFKNNSRLKYIDLSAIDINNLISGVATLKIATPDDTIRTSLYDYGILFPLIAACHTKVNYNPTAGFPSFKMEYIIPQLILQWIKKNNVLTDGIKYSCNRIGATEKSLYDDVFNFVFPVRSSTVTGHCDELINLFKVTDVIEAKHFSYSTTGIENQIKEIQQELSKGIFKGI